jgi:hypothetical protein
VVRINALVVTGAMIRAGASQNVVISAPQGKMIGGNVLMMAVTTAITTAAIDQSLLKKMALFHDSPWQKSFRGKSFYGFEGLNSFEYRIGYCHGLLREWKPCH